MTTQKGNYGITKDQLADRSGILTDDITYLQASRNLTDVASAKTSNNHLFINSFESPTPVSNAFTLDDTYFGSFVNLTNSGTPFTVALPTSDTAGFLTLFNEDSVDGTLSVSGGTIDGNATATLQGAESFRLYYDGANYHTLAYGPASGSSGGGISTVQGTISSVDLLALAVTPKLVVNSVNGYAITPINLSVEYVYGTTAYTVGTGSVLGLQIPGGAQYNSTTPCAGLLDQTNNVFSSVANLYLTGVPDPDTYIFNSNGISLNITGGTGLTLGDGTLNYWVSFILIPQI